MLPADLAAAIHDAAAEVAPRAIRRPVPDRRVPDRLGHVVQHERERGHRHARQPRARARRCTPTTTSTRRSRPTTCSRRRSTWPRAAADRHVAAARARAPGRGAGGEGRRVRRRGQERPDPPDGRHAGHARPGVRRLRGGGPARRRSGPRPSLPDVGELPLGGTAVGTGLNAPAWLRRPASSRAGRRHGPAAHRGAATTSRRPGPATRLVAASGVPRTIAVSLYKICNDLR